MNNASATGEDRIGRTLFELSIGVFFIGGFLTSAVGLLVPRLTITLGLDYARALLVQFAFHLSYLVFAVPVTLGILRVGYMRSIVAGLCIMVVACVLLTTATQFRSFPLVLLALLMLSTGITFLQIASNTVVTVFGPTRHAIARLTLLQGFNSLGTVLGPLIGAVFVLGSIEPGASATPGAWGSIPFLASALCIAMLATAFARHRNLLGTSRPEATDIAPRAMLTLLGDRRVFAGTVAMFAYVGAEVTIGSLLPNFLMLDETLHAAPVVAGQMTSLYWGGAMIGRFAGAVLLRRGDAGKFLAMAGVSAIILVVGASLTTGVVAVVALIAVGLCNAIMYPTIYALALPAKDSEAPMGSMLLCMAVVGGAVIPLATGALADRVGLALALLLPAICYAVIAIFGWSTRS